MLEVSHLSKRFSDKYAVKNVSFQVNQGDSFGLLGPNGAGKSTTISMVTGLLSPDEGEVTMHGKTMRKHPKFLKQRIGLVPQTIALYDTLTARENLEFWGTVYGITGSKLKDNVNWCLRVAGLEDNTKQLVKKYSGGMQRRLNIAVGMIHRPEVLIMDEPTVGIDPQSRNHILQTVKDLNKQGITVIYTSHYMEEVQFLCERLAIMDHGQVIAYGSLNDVRQLAGTLATITIEAQGDLDSILKELQQDLSLKNLQNRDGALVLQSTNAAAAVSKVVLAMSQHGLQPANINVEEPNLEAAFLHLTGRQLRDGGEGAV
ncbi:ABC transporter ATP-binding protein [Alicyclobacillus dauci]|uniref:ABC transporter ATP-binding protein n=1 Tax=Alicyclobacillus dauci TaxID=1475485 RepID=A0ABY6Z872_9BACL|nr:ABC transporter ATP-binding protein [Alicyclobacillus dauci]WAH38225.1 ABC transporter ATP-binding protein [Alicyclobacillus dauci]